MKSLIIISLILALLLITVGISSCAQTQEQHGMGTILAGQLCTKANSSETLSLTEAKQIALNSECNNGTLKEDTASCNEITGTWWIDLDIQKAGCSPACVINVETKHAEINWRCTGLIGN